MLKQRLITAIILIPLVVWSILTLETPIIAGLLAVFVVLAAWEWAGLCGWQTMVSRSLYALMIGMSLIAIYSWSLWVVNHSLMQYPSPISYFFIFLLITLLIALLWWLLALVWVVSYQYGFNRVPSHPLIKSFLGFLILLPAGVSLAFLHDLDEKLLLFLFILIWIADSGAYFVGRRWGKHKLADKISPGKTWEGVAGGILAGCLFAVGYTLLAVRLAGIVPPYNQISPIGYILFVHIELSEFIIFIILCILTVMASILGDLLESLFKRQIGVKDSGQLLPGHGGILDRIDSLTAAAPIFGLGILLLYWKSRL